MPFSFGGYDDGLTLNDPLTNTGVGQGTGGSGAGETYSWDIMNLAGTDVLNSGSTTGTLQEAINAAKAATAGLADWYIVIRLNGATVYSEGSQAGGGTGTEPGTQGEGGGTAGGEGSQTGGTGEAGVLAWRYRLTKNGADTATSDYVYPNREDARDAADALVPPLATRTDDYTIWVEANIAGWAPSSYDRPKNVNDSTTGTPGAVPPEAIGAALAALAIVAVGAAIYYAVGGDKA